MVTAPAPLRNVKAAKAAEVCEHFELEKKARPLLAARRDPARVPRGAAVGPAVPVRRLLPLPRPAHRGGRLVGEPLPDEGQRRRPARRGGRRGAGRARRGSSSRRRRTGRPRRRPRRPPERGRRRSSSPSRVGWTGGSLAPPLPKVPPVPPGPYLPAKGVYGAVLLAATNAAPLPVQEALRLFVELGVGVAEGRIPWPADVKPKKPGKTWGF